MIFAAVSDTLHWQIVKYVHVMHDHWPWFSIHTVGATLGLGSVSVGPALQVVVINDFSDDSDADDDEDSF